MIFIIFILIFFKVNNILNYIFVLKTLTLKIRGLLQYCKILLAKENDWNRLNFFVRGPLSLLWNFVKHITSFGYSLN